ncbi:MAG: hypothetical protein V3T05_07825 [Myxococcota bacterium]
MIVSAGCEKTTITPPPPGDASQVVPDPEDPPAVDVPLPVGWEGQGILASREERLPKRAPQWAAVAAQVIVRDDKRYLVATGRAERIRNAALARATAENRARAEIARWIASERVVGAMIVDGWRDPATGIAFAKLELEVPQEWVPGRPLPSGEQAAAPDDGGKSK